MGGGSGPATGLDGEDREGRGRLWGEEGMIREKEN